jgi:hypothetical protein
MMTSFITQFSPGHEHVPREQVVPGALGDDADRQTLGDVLFAGGLLHHKLAVRRTTGVLVCAGENRGLGVKLEPSRVGKRLEKDVQNATETYVDKHSSEPAKSLCIVRFLSLLYGRNSGRNVLLYGERTDGRLSDRHDGFVVEVVVHTIASPGFPEFTISRA